MLVIMELIVLGHDNYLTAFSLSPTLLPTSPHVFQLDQSHNHVCLEETLGICEDFIELYDIEMCIIHNLFHCLFQNPFHLKVHKHEHSPIKMYCIRYCFGELNYEGIRSASCLLDCFEREMKKY